MSSLLVQPSDLRMHRDSSVTVDFIYRNPKSIGRRQGSTKISGYNDGLCDNESLT